MLLGDTDEYEIEVKKYKNTTREKKIYEHMKSFERSIKMFQYKSQEVICEIGQLYDFAIRYYSRHILNLIYQYQNYDKNILRDTFEFLGSYVTKKEFELLHDDYTNYIAKNIIKFNIDNVPINVKSFFTKFACIFQSDETISLIYRNNHYNNVAGFIENNNMQDLLIYSYDHEMMELYLYLYIFFDTQFDYSNLLYANENNYDKIDIIDNTISAISVKVPSGGSYASGLGSMFIGESKNKLKLISEIFYLKRYSRIINKTTYQFVKKYGNRLKYFEGQDFDCLYNIVHNKIKI